MPAVKKTNVTVTGRKWDRRLMRIVERGWFPDHVYRVVLWGVPRSGKTFLPRTICKNLRKTQYNDGATSDDFLGAMGPAPEGGFKWYDGPVTDAMRHGHVLQVDEFDQLNSETHFLSHSVLDNPAGITLPTGERVEAKKGYGIIATQNPPPSVLPQTLYDRFDVMLKADCLSDGLYKALGRFAKVTENTLGQGYNDQGFKRGGSPGLFIAAATLAQAGLSDEDITDCLGLDEEEAAMFQAAISECK